MHEKKLNDLKGKIIQFSSHIEHMKDRSIRGLIDRDAEMLRGVIERDEPQANVIELDIEEICINLIAQYQPMAKDLRTILVVYNMSNTLERMADHTVNIAQNALELIAKPQIKPFLDIPRMSDIVRKMLDDTISSFINEDAELARSVCVQDDIIDALRDQIVRELITFMTGNAQIVGACINIMQIASNLERIADLTTNICEDVIFMSQGKVIKHYKDAQAAQAAKP